MLQVNRIGRREILSDNLDHIEKALLPPGYHFTKSQKEVLEANGSYNIIAGPGSGKTTVLTAKIADLLINRKQTDKGLCLITHTNVAVDEVQNSLKKIGIKSIEYPNFIGTIQEFFNYFFSIKVFNKLNGKKNIRILADEDYKARLDPIFRSRVSWYPQDYTIPNIKSNNVRLNVDEKKHIYFTNDGKVTYNEEFNISLKILFYNGIVTNQQCLELSDWYITKNLDLIKEALEARFSCILLDEAQDTNTLQYSLLEKLTTGTKIKYQKYGDPYQALYSIYENNSIDAWNPNNEIENGIQLKEIAETTRFGNSISNVVKNVCVENYNHFHSLEGITSLPAHFLIFNSKEELLTKYNKTIIEYEKRNVPFMKCDKKDVIVSDMHDNLSRYFPSYSKNKGQTAFEYNYKSIYNYLINEFSILFEKSKSEMISLLIENLDKRKLISILISELNSETIKKIKVEKVVGKIVAELNVNLEEFVDKIITQVTKEKGNDCEANQELYNYTLNTIHGVKGETHRSTMLILDSPLKFTYKGNNKFFELIKPFLIGRRFDCSGEVNKEDLNSALKLAYVALSRAKHLIIIAIPKKDINQYYKKKLIDNNWIEIQ